MTARTELIGDRGAAAEQEEFFRSRPFYAAEEVTHTLLIEGETARAALPVIVAGIPGTDLHDAVSPYGYPGAAVEGTAPVAVPAEVAWAGSGIVSLFARERLAGEPFLAQPRERSVVLVSDPGERRKSRMSDRQQIRRNEADGYRVRSVPGPDSEGADRESFHAVYLETMRQAGAAERYLFGRGYFDALLASPRTRLFVVDGPEGDVAAAAIAATSDGVVHYYLSGTAEAHRRRSPSKNLIVTVTDYAEESGLPMNLGGGVRPGDGLEEFKRGFANAELPFRTHEIVCDPDAYSALSAGREDTGFFPLYRSPGDG